MNPPSPALRLVSLFEAGATGEVLRRSSTYWHLAVFHPSLAEANVLIRLSFSGRAEAHFSQACFSSLTFPVSHPLLADHVEGWTRLTIQSPSQAPALLLDRLALRVSEATQGWRGLGPYLSLSGGPGALARGSGDLLTAPASLARLLLADIRTADVRVSIEHQVPRPGPAHLAVLGSNYIVAKRFAVKWGPPNKALKRTRLRSPLSATR